MSEELKQHLLSRRRDLSARIMLLQVILAEVESLLRFMDAPVKMTGTPKSLSALSDVGDDGLAATQIEGMIHYLNGENKSA